MTEHTLFTSNLTSNFNPAKRGQNAKPTQTLTANHNKQKQGQTTLPFHRKVRADVSGKKNA